MNPLDRLTTIISELMGKEPSDPDVLKAVVEVVMAIRLASDEMIEAGTERLGDNTLSGEETVIDIWVDMIDALLTDGEG